jgi:hypothetical protein
MTEFSRPLDIKIQLSKNAGNIDIHAKEDECKALAKRFSFHKIKNLSLKGVISERKNDDKSYVFHGILWAEYIKQAEEDLPEQPEVIQEDIALLLCKTEPESLDFDDMDFEIIEQGVVDFGEIVSQYFYLATDLFLDDHNLSVYPEDDTTNNPFDELKSLL